VSVRVSGKDLLNPAPDHRHPDFRSTFRRLLGSEIRRRRRRIFIGVFIGFLPSRLHTIALR